MAACTVGSEWRATGLGLRITILSNQAKAPGLEAPPYGPREIVAGTAAITKISVPLFATGATRVELFSPACDLPPRSKTIPPDRWMPAKFNRLSCFRRKFQEESG